MSNWYVFCDTCGKRCLASKTTRLTTHTGKPGLVVCYEDKDQIDGGLVPYTVPTEQSIPWTRQNHKNTTISSPYIDQEVMKYSYWLVPSQNEFQVISPSQSNYTGLTVNEDL